MVRAAGACGAGGAVLAVCGAALAFGFGGWSRLRVLSVASPAGQVTSYAHVAGDGRGDLVAVWAQATGTSATVVMISSRTPSGPWSTPKQLSPGPADFPRLAVAKSGAAVVVWDAMPADTAPTIQAAYRLSARAEWSQPIAMSSATLTAVQPTVAIDGRGRANVAWIARTPDGDYEVQASTVTRGSGAPGSVVTLASARHVLIAPQLASDPRGDVVLAWRSWVSGSVIGSGLLRGQAVAALRTSGHASWGRARTLGQEAQPAQQDDASFEFVGPQVAMDSRGDAVAVWQEAAPHGAIAIAFAQWRPSRQRWTAARVVGRGSSLWPHVAVSPSRTATVVWLSTTKSGRSVVRSSHHAITRCCWSPPVTLVSSTAQVGPPHIAAGPSGELVASWSRNGANLQTVVRTPGARRWSVPVSLGQANGGPPDIAFSASSTAVLIWPQPKVIGGRLLEDTVDFVQQR